MAGTYLYTTKDTTMRGEITEDGVAVKTDLDLQQGWNLVTVKVDAENFSQTYQNGSLEDLAWYFDPVESFTP